MEALRVGIIGCGNISDRYFAAGARFPQFEVVACADRDPACAERLGAEFGVRACAVEALLADPAVSLVINLTTPGAHYAVSRAALEAGKAVYSEKPLAATVAEGRELLALAAEKELLLGCAPDTVLGAGVQTARKLVDDGWIGAPLSGTAFMQCHGHEHWHPDPAFYYQPGGGPLFDMGPYYLHALLTLLGPVKRVCGMTRRGFETRTISSEARRGQQIPVEVSTHVAAILEFKAGAVVTLIMSFDVWAHTLPHLEIHGTEGSLSLPDPNTFGGEVRLQRAGAEGWSTLPHSHAYAEQSRGLGVADMALAMREGRPHRVDGAIGLHVLEVMHAIHEAGECQRYVTLRTTCTRPEPMPMQGL